MLKSSLRNLRRPKRWTKKFAPANLATAARATGRDHIFCVWEDRGSNRGNWGDALNPELVSLLSGKKAVNAPSVFNFASKPVYAVVGSILQSQLLPFVGGNVEVWGAGLIGENRKMSVRPGKVHAVRGPLTREILLADGIDCPEVYGDPAIVYPVFYRPKAAAKTHKLGIIPHYVDQGSAELIRFKEQEDVEIIDIRSGIKATVDKASRCSFIASSSLHGVIIAESYGIPAVWITVSEALIGDGFKFDDYYRSTHREGMTPVRLSDVSSPDDLPSMAPAARPEIDLARLLRACPFLAPGSEVESQVADHPMHRLSAE